MLYKDLLYENYKIILLTLYVFNIRQIYIKVNPKYNEQNNNKYEYKNK